MHPYRVPLRPVVAVVTGAALLAGCGGGAEPGAAPSAAPASSTSPTPSADATPSPAPAETPAAETTPVLPPVTDPVSLPALMAAEPDAGRPRVLRTTERTDAFTRSEVTYRNGERTVSGVLLRPTGPGPFPAVVLAHGYIEPSVYTTGQGMAREQVALAQAGFVVLHTDYRGHAAASPAGDVEREARVGYVSDTAAAVTALTRLPYVDDERLALMGRSMGGGVVQGVLVAHPGLVDVAVVHASVSSDFLENQRWFSEPGRPDVVRGFRERHGTPRASPDFYAGLSARTYYDRITEPVLAVHGSVDDTCPPRWARRSQALMEQAGVDARLRTYEGEGHTFYARWAEAMDDSIRFIRRGFRA